MKAEIVTAQGMSGGWTYLLGLEGAGISSITPQNAFNIETEEEAESEAKRFIELINKEGIQL